MTNKPACGNAPRLPAGAMNRLALFGEWTGTTPPDRVVVGKGKDMTFSRELLDYANATGLSLDWFWLNDERPLVMAAHRRAKAVSA